MMHLRSASARERQRPPRRRRTGARPFAGAVTLVAALLVAGAGSPAHAQYADGGEGLHRGSIDWFEWGNHGDAIPAKGMQRTNTRMIAGQTLATTCAISDIDGELEVYRPGTWEGDALDELYNVGGTGNANQLVTGIVNAHHYAFDSFRLSCGVTLDGVDVPIQGLVVADAEASNEAVPALGSKAEYLEARPEQPATWRIIDRYRAPGCTATTVATRSADDTVRFGTDGRECTATDDGGSGPMVVGFMEGATSAEISLQGGGRSAIAVGVVLHTDFGDAPAGYGAAGALFEPQWSGGTLPVGTTAVSDDTFALATLGAPALRLGDLIDSEPAPIFSNDARGDDDDGESDEDAVTIPAEGITVTPGRAFTLSPVQCAGDGWVAGWIDWTGRGSFAPTDRSNVVKCADGSAELTWDVPADAAGTTADAWTFLRLRIGPDEASLAAATGLTLSGEVEDHALPVRLSQAAITAAKSADPATGSAVEPGQTVSYTLTFGNDGDGPGAVDYHDDLSGVLDDADLVGAPQSSDPALTVTRDGDRFRIAGTLEAGQVVHVTYSVRVRDAAARGDHALRNVLAPASIDEPTCDLAGVLCTEHGVPNLAWWKQVEADSAPVAAGTTLTYTLLFENSGTADAPLHAVDHLGFASDDLTFDGTFRTTDPLTAVLDGDVITITGTVPAGTTYRVSYDGVAKPDAERGDDLAVNFLRAPGDPVPTAAVCQDASERPDCTSTPIGRVVASKSVDDVSARSGDGSVLSYTLLFQNETAEDARIDHVDLLDGVLDDAEIASEPLAMHEALTVDPVADGSFRIRGMLPAGETATVVYDVALKPQEDRGDNRVVNFLVVNGEEPPSSCLPDDAMCTVTPLPALRVEKSSDPASETLVAPGDTVTYTLAFTNDGDAPAAVDHVDDLADVFDDATLADAPSSSESSVRAELGDDDVLRMVGSIAPGDRVEVTYSVVVDAQSEGGDGLLRNTVMRAGDPVPEECVAGLCTRHPVLFPVEPLIEDPAPAPGSGAGSGTPLALTGAMLPLGILGLATLMVTVGGVLISRRRRT